MADISDVNASQIKDLYQHLEDLSCTSALCPRHTLPLADIHLSSDHDESSVLNLGVFSINYCHPTDDPISSWVIILRRFRQHLAPTKALEGPAAISRAECFIPFCR